MSNFWFVYWKQEIFRKATTKPQDDSEKPQIAKSLNDCFQMSCFCYESQKLILVLTEGQYKYLMMGLNPLDPKIKDVDPKNIY